MLIYQGIDRFLRHIPTTPLRPIPTNLRLLLIFMAKKHPAKLLDAFLVIDADLFAVFKVEVN